MEHLTLAPPIGPFRLRRLLARTPPGRLTHLRVRDSALLQVYRDSSWSETLVLSGTVGDARLIYDPIVVAPELAFRPRTPGIDLTVTGDPALVAIAGPTDLATARTWLDHPNLLVRIAAIRRLALDPAIDVRTARAAHLDALSNDATAVRQHAAVHLSGFNARRELRIEAADVRAMLAGPPVERADPRVADGTHVQAPEVASGRAGASLPPAPEVFHTTERPFPQRPDGWSADRARRDVRHAAVWVIANLVRSPPDPWRDQVLTELLQEVEPADPAWIRARVADELIGGMALGTTDPVTLGEVIAFALARAEAVGTDPYPWLVRDARLILDEAARRRAASGAR